MNEPTRQEGERAAAGHFTFVVNELELGAKKASPANWAVTR